MTNDGSAQIAPYGTWKSPISSEWIVADTVTMGEMVLGEDTIYWIEGRPKEAGRYVIMGIQALGEARELTPAGFNARTRVHEYGGGAFLVAEGEIVFSNFADQRLYRQSWNSDPVPLTPEAPWRYADGVFDAQRRRIISVREDHSHADQEAVNTLVAIPWDNAEGEQSVLVSGNDFVSSPRLSPDGRHLAWLTWDHPRMPWDGTELWVAEISEEGSLNTPQKVAGSETESIFQPEWSPNGQLYFISDRTGWWNLYRQKVDSPTDPVSVCSRDAEFGVPQWVFGLSTYGFESADSIICTYIDTDGQHIARLQTETGELTPFNTPFSSYRFVRVRQNRALFLGGSPTQPTALSELDLTSGAIKIHKQSSSVAVDAGYLSVPEAVEFSTENGLTAHAYYYPPRNQDVTAPPDEKPPLLVRSHGGPTGSTSTNFNLGIQYWTSRGFAVVDVNYGGSTGYGRDYRNRLRGQWGVVDVDDCVNAAKYLVNQGLADSNRLTIDGGSAGGYTTLCALTFRDVFHAGASHFGLSELLSFVGDTHKFESRYLDSLIGSWTEEQELYKQRSPFYFANQLSCPVIFFQGDEDKIVPPSQAEVMVEALKEKGVAVAYVLFAGEQHGFRQSENIRRALDGEFWFYAHIFGFEPADDIEPVPIWNDC